MRPFYRIFLLYDDRSSNALHFSFTCKVLQKKCSYIIVLLFFLVTVHIDKRVEASKPHCCWGVVVMGLGVTPRHPVFSVYFSVFKKNVHPSNFQSGTSRAACIRLCRADLTRRGQVLCRHSDESVKHVPILVLLTAR